MNDLNSNEIARFIMRMFKLHHVFVAMLIKLCTLFNFVTDK